MNNTKSPPRKRRRIGEEYEGMEVSFEKITVTQELYWTLEDLKEVESDYDPIIYYKKKGNVCPYA